MNAGTSSVTFPSGITITVVTELDEITADPPVLVPQRRLFYVNGVQVHRSIAALTLDMHRGMKP